MIHTIQNDIIKVGVQQTGAELCSIQWLADGTEFIWPALPGGWSNHAPILFPVIGRLKEDNYWLEGQQYTLPKHGLLRNNPHVECIETKADRLTFRFVSNKKTMLAYPFAFEMIVTFRIKNNWLIQSFVVKNHEKKDMYCSLGGHPAFYCPVDEGEDYADYYLLFDRIETEEPYLLQEDGLVSDDRVVVFEGTNLIRLTNHLFDRDALILKKLKSREVRLKSRKSNNQVKVSFPDFDYLGLWAKPGAHFICIEPWMGMADRWDTDQQLKNKEGIRTLPAREEFHAAFSIEVSR